jgi:hypothetical protein
MRGPGIGSEEAPVRTGATDDGTDTLRQATRGRFPLSRVGRTGVAALAATAALLAAGVGAQEPGPEHRPARSALAHSAPVAAMATPVAAPPVLRRRAAAVPGARRASGLVGRVEMLVGAPVTVQGVETLPLRFDFEARVGPVRAVDRSASWLDPRRMRALRFAKHERHLLARHDEQVEIDPARRRWTAADGTVGESASDQPLDELSFMYFVRTLALGTDSAWTFDRHFDPRRSPTRVRVVGRRTVTTEAGTFHTVTLELRVRDPRRYRGEGTITLDVTDDACRLPVRIESEMPRIGTTVMTLAAQNHPEAHH